jgi:hypothetical protein
MSASTLIAVSAALILALNVMRHCRRPLFLRTGRAGIHSQGIFPITVHRAHGRSRVHARTTSALFRNRPLTKTDAETFLDWLEANDYPPHEVNIAAGGFTCTPRVP